jgi:hypothetical protein
MVFEVNKGPIIKTLKMTTTIAAGYILRTLATIKSKMDFFLSQLYATKKPLIIKNISTPNLPMLIPNTSLIGSKFKVFKLKT